MKTKDTEELRRQS